MARSKRERVSVRLEAEVNSIEGHLLKYLKADPIIPPRESALRALKAFYMPWALEGEVDEAQLQRLASTAVEELQFRIFQIQQRYGAGASPGYITPAPRQGVVANSVPNGVRMAPASPAPTIAEMRQNINAEDLDDF
ncbi:MAG: hypothetical protein AB4042_16660 [Leptolyngbyaceae cyanobacterium]